MMMLIGFAGLSLCWLSSGRCAWPDESTAQSLSRGIANCRQAPSCGPSFVSAPITKREDTMKATLLASIGYSGCDDDLRRGSRLGRTRASVPAH